MSTIHRRKFSEDEKHVILNEASHKGISVVLREYRLSYSVFSRWKKQLVSDKKEPKSNYRILQELKDLVAENERLKRIIANQALEIQIKTEKLGNINA
jgi:transposase-like protein